ncbi:MAG: hypothetical protein H0X66_20985 [Verrucomicrobia bacterium]|nr:hypothetical protein [Verrucomicrobiota bacterium]
MKVVFHSQVAAPSLIGRYRFAEQRLREAGIASEIRTGVDASLVVQPGDVLVSHNWIPASVRAQSGARCFGGVEQTRPENLALLASLGFPVMEWTTVENQDGALALFSTWGVDRLILKRSFTGGGHGFHVLTSNQPSYCEWDYARDVLCKEVNPDCGKVFKAELFAGKLMLGFVLKKEPLKDRLLPNDPCPDGARQLLTYREDKARPDDRHRELWEFSQAEQTAFENLSTELTALGFGYVSLDLMRKPDGQLVAIELNTGSVTTWWSETFPFVRERFASALLDLVKEL